VCIQLNELNSVAANVMALVRSYTSPVDSAFDIARAGLGYPLVPASQVTLVTREADCKKARDAYQTKMGNLQGYSGRVVVVKAGNTFTVLDPSAYYNPANRRNLYGLFDSHFALISKML
jgi:hypothetical protein